MSGTQRQMRSGIDLPDLYLPPKLRFGGKGLARAERTSVIYTRFSSESQKETSTDRQYDDCSAYEKSKKLINVGRYDDKGVSGTTTEREQLQLLLQDAHADNFTDVVVESLDRVARKLRVAVEIFEELLELGITVHDVEEGRALNIYDIGQKGAGSQAARDLLVKRAQAGIRRGAADGTFGVASCFGYERVWDEDQRALIWKKKENEAKIVVEIFEMFASGVSAQRICDILNARPPSERGYRLWTRGALVGDRNLGTGILRRMRYRGVRVHGRVKIIKVKGVWKVDVHPVEHWVVSDLADQELVIIEKPLFDRVHRMLSARGEAAAEKRAQFPRYYSAKQSPLAGLIRCIHCGSTMTPTQKRREGKPRLLCNKARNKHGCSNQRSWKLDAVEDEIHRMLVEHVGPEAVVLHYVDIYNGGAKERADEAAERKRELERELTTADNRLDRIREDEERGRYPKKHLEGKRIKANEAYAAIETKLSEVEASLQAAPVVIDPEERIEAHRRLMGSLSGLFSPGFDASSKTGTQVVAFLQGLIQSVVLDIEHTGCTVHLKCRMVDPDDDSERNLATFTSRLERKPHVWEASKREVRRVAEVVERGDRSVTDEEWRQIAHLVPDTVGRSRRGGESVDKRKIVDAALLHLWEGVPLLYMPEKFGSKDAVFAGLKRLSESGGWDAVADTLRKIAPERIPDVKSNMFSTDRTKVSSSLKGLPLIRARHGVAAAAGKHAPGDAIWRRVGHIIPEQVLQINQEPAYITPRTFLHGILFWLCEKIPMTHLPLIFGSYYHFNHAMSRFSNHGQLDQLVEALQAMSPSPLKGAELKVLDRFPRSAKEAPIWRRALPKRSDFEGIPEHFPDERTWSLVQHLFPADILFFKEKAVIRSPRILAHAILYRIKEEIPFSVMPEYFGRPEDVQRCATLWTFHHLWAEFRRVLLEHAPDVLEGANLATFDNYKRGRRFRYRDLINSERAPPPAHQPSEEDFALMEDLIPLDVLEIRGGPAIMEPRKFFHAIVFMLKERTQFGGLPPFFGRARDMHVATRRFVAHHYWDTMRGRIEHFAPDWAVGADLTIFDTLKRSKNPEPEFRKRKARRP